MRHQARGLADPAQPSECGETSIISQFRRELETVFAPDVLLLEQLLGLP
jgi:hypothetical protein